jgi:hypothetical protein
MLGWSDRNICRLLSNMTNRYSLAVRFILAVGIYFQLVGVAKGHSGIVDGYGCHRGSDRISYHCHQGQFSGRTFKSKENFLRELRAGKSEQLPPKSNLPPLEKKRED